MLRYASLLSTLLLAGSAHAALVTIEYSSTITTLEFEEYMGGPAGLVNNVDMGTFTVRKGETVTGRFTYDDATPLIKSLSPDSNYYYARNVGSYTLTFEGSGTTVDLTNTQVGANRYGQYDSFGFGGEAGRQKSGAPYINAALTLLAPIGTHDPATLPGATDIPAYNLQSSYFSPLGLWMNLGESYIWVSTGEVTAQVVSSVPEPATYAMLAAGLGLIGVAARRRKSTAA